MLTYPRNLEGSITILGEKGTVKIGGTAVNRVEHWQFADYDDDDKLVESAATNPPTVYGFGHEGYYRNVLAVLRGEATPTPTAARGRKSLELILGIYESAKTGREVPIPLRATLTSQPLRRVDDRSHPASVASTDDGASPPSIAHGHYRSLDRPMPVPLLDLKAQHATDQRRGRRAR